MSLVFHWISVYVASLLYRDPIPLPREKNEIFIIINYHI